MSSRLKAPRMEPNTWTMQPLARQRRLVTARGYDERWTHLGPMTASQRRIGVRHVQEVALEHLQTRSVVWCAEGAASLSATRRCDPLVFGAMTVACVVDGVALALRGRPRVHRDRESAELSQGFLQAVSS